MIIRVKRKGKSSKELLGMIKTKKIKSEQYFINLGHKTHSIMQGIIDKNTKRQGSTGALKNSISFSVSRQHMGLKWEIGEKDKLKKYWAIINYGGIPGGGKYRPYMFTDGAADPSQRGTGVGKSRATGIGKISNIGGKEPSPIAPMNFVAKTVNWLTNKLTIKRFTQLG